MNMKNNYFFLIFLLFLGHVTVFGAPSCFINRTAVAPVIDGSDDDACWYQSIEMAGLVVPVSLNYATEQTSLRLLWDKDNLYGIIKCEQKEVSKLSESKRKDDILLWSNNSVELFFVNDKDDFYQLIINTEGTVADLRKEGTKTIWDWDSTIKIKSVKTENQWMAEFAIPLKSLKFTPSSLKKFNFVRNNKIKQEYSSWVPLKKRNWAQLDKFGFIKLVEGSTGISFSELPSFKPNSSIVISFYGGRQAESYEVVLNNEKSAKKYNVQVKAHTKASLEIPNDKTRAKKLTFSISTGKTVIYNLEYTPKGEVIEVYANNMVNKKLFLSPDMPAVIMWNSVHTLPVDSSIPGKKVREDYEIVFDCPKGVRVKDATKKSTSSDGRRFIWVSKQRFAYGSPNWLSSKIETTLEEKETGKIYYYVKWGEKEQASETLNFEVLRIHKIVPPKRFMTRFYNWYVSSVDVALAYKQFGINTISYRHYNVDLTKRFLKAGFYVLKGSYFFPGKINNYNDWARKDRSARAMDINGNVILGSKGPQFSPSYRGKYFKQAIQKEREYAKATGVNCYAFDIEGYMMPNAKAACFNPETLRRFKFFFKEKYSNKKYINPKKFEKEPENYPEYHEAWVNFKDYIFADFFLEFKRQLKDVVGQTVPWEGVVISEWALAVPTTLEHINETMRGPRVMQAFDFFELDGYSSADRYVREAMHRFRLIHKLFPKSKTRFLGCPSPERLDLNRKKDNFYYDVAPVLPEELKYKIMESAALGLKGIAVYNMPAMNLRAWKYWTEGIQIVNKVEDIAINGKWINRLSCDQPLGVLAKVTIRGGKESLYNQPKILVKGVEQEDQAIIAVSEYRDLTPVTVTVCYPVKKVSLITDVETGETIGEIGPQKLSFKISLKKRRCRLLLVKTK